MPLKSWDLLPISPPRAAKNAKLIYDCPKAACVYSLFTGRCRDKCKKRYKVETAEESDSFTYWEHRAKHNDYLWVECSNCGFTVENYKAVVLDKCDTKFSEVIYKFCPMCGKAMSVH